MAQATYGVVLESEIRGEVSRIMLINRVSDENPGFWLAVVLLPGDRYTWTEGCHVMHWLGNQEWRVVS